jgi:starch phosphorylase
VPAGIDVFPRWMMEKYFKRYAEEELKISFDELFLEGDLYRSTWTENFNMAALAINNSNFVNGVSKLHGKISSKMWSLPPTRTQIDSITNGVHIRTYLSPYSEKTYRKFFGETWYNEDNIWEKISLLPDQVIWEMRNRNREYLIKYVREKLTNNLKSQNATDEEIEAASSILSPDVMTIGFARRFATYKRGTLIFRDVKRLKEIINGSYKVQFIFSGKAHPKDEGGKNLISEIIQYTQDAEFKGKIIFLDNYDMEIAKYLVAGCDVWLNNPRRPLEASGTSGMKTVANGGLNFSILDGWWMEAYDPACGWKIESPGEEENLSEYEVDLFEAKSLYDTLENEILPLFYKRDENNIPVEWIQMIKNSIKKFAGYFNTERMVKEYNEKFYSKTIDISKPGIGQ